VPPWEEKEEEGNKCEKEEWGGLERGRDRQGSSKKILLKSPA